MFINFKFIVSNVVEPLEHVIVNSINFFHFQFIKFFQKYIKVKLRKSYAFGCDRNRALIQSKGRFSRMLLSMIRLECISPVIKNFGFLRNRKTDPLEKKTLKSDNQQLFL